MDDAEKREYSTWVGLGLICGVGIGATLDVLDGTFTGVTAAVGAGMGIVIGSLVGHLRLRHLKK